MTLRVATLSNCGNVLRAFATAPTWKHSRLHQGNDLGYGKNAKDWTIRSQVLRMSAYSSMDAVHRLDGNGFWFSMARA